MSGAARWEFATATRILFGRGTAAEAAAIVAGLGRRALVVSGSTPTRAEWLVNALDSMGLEPRLIYVEGEPTVAFAADAAAFARRMSADVVVAIGGGSALDTGKAIAALATNTDDVFDYLEVVGRGVPLSATPLPFVAIPTTAGTGAEVTKNAVLAVPDRRVKVSLRSPLMLPRVAIVDPALTRTLPPAATAFTGLDALTQNIEPFLSWRATPLTDALCRDGIGRVARSLRRAWADGEDLDAREDMAVASLCGGLALANAGLGAVHGLAGPIGGMFNAPHGAVCAALLPHVCRVNLRALEARAPEHHARARAAEVARLLTGRAHATMAHGVAWLGEMVQTLGVPTLAQWGVTPTDLPALVNQAIRSSSMAANPVALEPDELTEILSSAL
ncbi:MAG: iron-containing alcohol dehydrogenase [Vicinamibacterales bacterium]|nr:iron-containing alcohol dehydrogenase [Vicinamibacterales bacterium]